MSERTNAPRSGGRAAQPRSTAGERGRGAAREAATGGIDARGARRSGRTGAGPRGADTRRSGMRSDEGRGGAGLRVEGDIQVQIEGTAAKRLDTGEAAVPVLPRLRVAPPMPIRAPRPMFAAGLIALVLLGVVGIQLINTKAMEQTFRLEALRKNQATLDEQQQELQQQLNQVSSPGNLAAAARRLGLVQANPPAMIRLPDGKIIRTPSPGKGQTSVTAQESLTTGAANAPATPATQGATGQNATGQNATGQNATGQNATGQSTTGQNTGQTADGQNGADQNAVGTGQ